MGGFISARKRAFWVDVGGEEREASGGAEVVADADPVELLDALGKER